MDFIFLGAGAANGYDQLGHFLRTEGVGGNCVKYFIAAGPGLQPQARHRRLDGERAGLERLARTRGPRDGAHARGAERRDPGPGGRQIPGHARLPAKSPAAR